MRRKAAIARAANSAQNIAGVAEEPVFATGILLFLSEAIKCFYSIPFWIKMASLLLVLLFTFTLLRRAVQTDVTVKRPGYGRSLAIISLILWFGVAWGGRWIGFS